MSKAIYKVTCVDHNLSYIVVAHNSNEAYTKLRKMLDEKDYGFYQKRDLNILEVIASKVKDDDYDDIYEIVC